MSFHIVFQSSFEISFQILQDKYIAMIWVHGQNFCSVMYTEPKIYLTDSKKDYVHVFAGSQVRRPVSIYRLQVSFLFKFTSLTRLFHSYRDEPIGRWGEKIVPQENHLTHPQAELALSYM